MQFKGCNLGLAVIDTATDSYALASTMAPSMQLKTSNAVGL